MGNRVREAFLFQAVRRMEMERVEKISKGNCSKSTRKIITSFLLQRATTTWCSMVEGLTDGPSITVLRGNAAFRGGKKRVGFAVCVCNTK